MAPNNANGNGQSRADAEQIRRANFVANIMSLSRMAFSRHLLDPRRDIDDECGFPKEPTVEEYQKMYDRDAIAARVVEVLPRECWQVTPSVYEDEDSKSVTEFEKAWDGLGKQLRGEQSWYADESGSPVWEVLKRADELSGIGHYGVVLLGLDDGGKLDQPVKKGKPGSRKLLFMRAFPESLAQITQFETSPTSPRYGMPTEYLVTFNDPHQSGVGGIGLQAVTANVHWSRCVHVCEGTGPSVVFHIPRMQQVYNNLLSLRKVYGGSGEAYWKGCVNALSLETNPQLGGDVDVNKEELKDMMEAFANGLQRWLQLSGMSAKSIAPTVTDPTVHIAVQLEAICIKIGCPIRIFKGSERGELASSQDDDAWNDRLKERQSNHVTPRIVIPTVDRLIAVGVLPEPEGYKILWPDLTSKSDQEKATVALTLTQAAAAYVGGNVETICPPLDWFVRFLDWDEDEAASVLKDAAKEQADKEAEQLLQQKKQAQEMAKIQGQQVSPNGQPPGAPPPGQFGKAAVPPTGKIGAGVSGPPAAPVPIGRQARPRR